MLMIGTQMVGVQMVDPELITHVHEMRLLMHILWKTHRLAHEQQLANYEGGMSHLQAGILRMLFHEENLTPSELSRRFHIDPSTLVPTINTLEEKQLITRGRDPNDRRRMPLTLTERGIEVVKNMPGIDENDPLLIAMRGIGEEKTHLLLKLMCETIHHLPGEQDTEMMQHFKSRLEALGAKEEYLICQQP